jgi:cytochrome oxidase Cu insertion factor (SCO1/SenC/PrrC family)
MPKPHYSPSRFQLVFAILAVSAAVIIAGVTFYLSSLTHGPISNGTALVGGPFTLTDQNGRKVSEKDFLGKYMLVFFGYTYCPDICPTELQVMSAALDSLGAKADAVQPVFISVDPERDTPEVLKQYVGNFHPRLMGLTGTPEEIASVAKTYRVFFSRVENSGSDTYPMDHSTIMYLMDPQGKFLKHFNYSTDAAALAKALAEAISG